MEEVLEERVMILEIKSTGELFAAREKHIVFPVSDQGCEPNGSAAMLFLKWPNILKHCLPFVPVGKAIQEDGKNFYPLQCYFRRIDGCKKTPEILKRYLLAGLPVRRSTTVGVILPGCSETEMSSGADIETNLDAVRIAAESRKIVLYADLPDRLQN